MFCLFFLDFRFFLLLCLFPRLLHLFYRFLRFFANILDISQIPVQQTFCHRGLQQCIQAILICRIWIFFLLWQFWFFWHSHIHRTKQSIIEHALWQRGIFLHLQVCFSKNIGIVRLRRRLFLWRFWFHILLICLLDQGIQTHIVRFLFLRLLLYDRIGTGIQFRDINIIKINITILCALYSFYMKRFKSVQLFCSLYNCIIVATT